MNYFSSIPPDVLPLILIGGLMFGLLFAAGTFGGGGNLNGIKSKKVGDGQHGTARFASPKEIKQTYKHIPYKPREWRKDKKSRPKAQGLVVGNKTFLKNHVTALVDDGDVHALMIGASGVGKTAFFLLPNLEYACASGMSFLVTDTKGDVYRDFAGIARDCYGYTVTVIDLRNPTQSAGFNMLQLVNRYMDIYLADPKRLDAKAKAETYAKIIAKTIIQSDGNNNYGQNSYFYDAAEGLLAAMILLVAEFCPSKERHIVSVFKLVQDLMMPTPLLPGSKAKPKPQLQAMLERLPSEHKARWLAGAAINSAEQSTASVLSTAMSRLNAFLDTSLEQMLCTDQGIDAHQFCSRKSALFLVMPEEAPTTYFLISLIIQQLYREILVVADGLGGKLKNRVVFFCDEVGTLPKIESFEMMLSAARSRRVTIVPIVQSLAQLERNYGKEGASIISDNCQLTIFGGFAPNSQTAEVLSKNMGEQTVLSGSVSKGKDSNSRSLQMMGRLLMTSDELKAFPKSHFVVMKTGMHPMKTVLPLFLKWGIRLNRPFSLPENPLREVAYADKSALEKAIIARYPPRPLRAQAVDYENGNDSGEGGGSGGFSMTDPENVYNVELAPDDGMVNVDARKKGLVTQKTSA